MSPEKLKTAWGSSYEYQGVPKGSLRFYFTFILYHIVQLWVQLCSEGANYKREGGNDGINTPEEGVNYKREWEMIGRKE